MNSSNERESFSQRLQQALKNAHADQLQFAQMLTQTGQQAFLLWAGVPAAGGVVLQLDGEAFSYPARESLLNQSFLALPAQAPWREKLLDLAQR